jgi:hypothetical protein
MKRDRKNTFRKSIYKYFLLTLIRVLIKLEVS